MNIKLLASKIIIALVFLSFFAFLLVLVGFGIALLCSFVATGLGLSASEELVPMQKSIETIGVGLRNLFLVLIPFTLLIAFRAQCVDDAKAFLKSFIWNVLKFLIPLALIIVIIDWILYDKCWDVSTGIYVINMILSFAGGLWVSFVSYRKSHLRHSIP